MVTCADSGCAAQAFNEEHALYQGWSVVGGALFCPLHGSIAARQVRNQRRILELRELVDAKKAEELQKEAKSWLSARDRLAWDEFQEQLVNFHKKFGKLAPRQLRLLDPQSWLARHTQTGPINVEHEALSLEEAENKPQNRSKRSW